MYYKKCIVATSVKSVKNWEIYPTQNSLSTGLIIRLQQVISLDLGLIILLQSLLILINSVMYTPIAVYMVRRKWNFVIVTCKHGQFIISHHVDAIMYLLIFSSCTQFCMCIRISSGACGCTGKQLEGIIVISSIRYSNVHFHKYQYRLMFTILLEKVSEHNQTATFPTSHIAQTIFMLHTDYIQYKICSSYRN